MFKWFIVLFVNHVLGGFGLFRCFTHESLECTLGIHLENVQAIPCSSVTITVIGLIVLGGVISTPARLMASVCAG